MPTVLTGKAKEKSTYVINASFEDEDGDAVVPDTITWTLSDVDGTVINSRQDVSIAVPAASNDIVLSGDDLALQGAGDTKIRVFTIEATYDSDLANDLPLNGEARFAIEALTNIP